MRSKQLCPFFFILLLGWECGWGQTKLPIYEIQGKDNASAYVGQTIQTEGVVTLSLFAPSQIGGFFIQDTAGDHSISTSDGIFVYGRANVKVGDYLRLTATVNEYFGRTQLNNYSNLEILKQKVSIPYVKLIFPEDFINRYESLEGMAIELNQTMVVTSTNSLGQYGQLNLASKRLRAPTDQAYPKTLEYTAAVAWNSEDDIYLDDGSDEKQPNPIPFLDKDGTRRTGSKIDTLHGVLNQITSSIYALYPTEAITFYGNERTQTPEPTALGKYNLKICGFNVENFYNESSLQLKRIVKAVKAIDADIIGFCEIKQGRDCIQALVKALNEAEGANIYAYIDLGSATSSYTVVQMVYKTTKVEPFKNHIAINNAGPINRKLVQAFKLKENGSTFILSLNHFKAKSGNGTGANADQGDGQGVYNYQRTQEANAVIGKLKESVYYYGSDKILVIGDLNSFAKEDPIQIFNQAGYENQCHRFSDSSYSYRFGSQVEYLDYSLANKSMAEQITGALVWHINADEPNFLDFERCTENQDFLYRCSDHDPVIIGLNLQGTSNENATEKGKGENIILYPNPCKDQLFIIDHGQVKDPWKEKKMVQIYSITGRLLQNLYLAGEDPSIDMSPYAQGAYLIKTYGNMGVSTNKVIKK
ncbi:MAG: ExeM/NucH family extracellular endonuclease [Bacteroidales bacterium]